MNKIEFSVWQKLGIKLSGEKMIDETLGPKFGYSLFFFFFFPFSAYPLWSTNILEIKTLLGMI